MKTDNEMKYSNLLALAIATIMLLGSCKQNSNDLFGTWQLNEFCYGSDCSHVTDHGIVQLWQFNSDALESTDNKTVYSGRQFQEGIMDNDIMWSLSTKKDTLFTFSKTGDNPDTFLVQRIDNDTLVLSSMMNNILVQQQFVRSEKK